MLGVKYGAQTMESGLAKVSVHESMFAFKVLGHPQLSPTNPGLHTSAPVVRSQEVAVEGKFTQERVPVLGSHATYLLGSVVGQHVVLLGLRENPVGQMLLHVLPNADLIEVSKTYPGLHIGSPVTLSQSEALGGRLLHTNDPSTVLHPR